MRFDRRAKERELPASCYQMPDRKFRKHRVRCVYACVHLETRIDAHAYVYGAVIIRFQCVKGDGVPRENGLEPSSWLAITFFPLREIHRLKDVPSIPELFLRARSLNDQTRQGVAFTRNSATTEIHIHTHTVYIVYSIVHAVSC